MITLSREAKLKVAKHAWNVFPLEAFGFLLGRMADNTVYAALPSCNTRHPGIFEDRWVGMDTYFEQASYVAKAFDLEIVGLYASTEEMPGNDYPIPSQIAQTSLQLLILYRMLHCPSCSGIDYNLAGLWLSQEEEPTVQGGKRYLNSINQKKVLKKWREATIARMKQP
jgi:hypothetical protein